MPTVIQNIPLKTITGEDTKLGDYAGKVVLLVNVASKCGLTPQYEALEKLYNEYKDKGFVVIGVPANNFGAQEPGTEAEISEFCTTNYGVDFPMLAKISVKGHDQHPLYRTLTTEKPTKTYKDNSFKEKLRGYGIDTGREDEVTWNFEKFLIGKDGAILRRFAPDIAPDDPFIVTAIKVELAR